MKNLEMFTKILDQCYAMGSALETLGYALGFLTYNIDINEDELRKIINHISGSIKCFADYHEKITDDIENIKYELIEIGYTDPDEEKAKQRYMEERLVWVYRHMDANDKGRLDRYCDRFKLGYDFRGEGESSVVKGQGEADTP